MKLLVSLIKTEVSWCLIRKHTIKLQNCVCVTWEGGRWGRCRYGDGNAHAAAATVLPAAAPTAAAGMAAPTATTAHTHRNTAG